MLCMSKWNTLISYISRWCLQLIHCNWNVLSFSGPTGHWSLGPIQHTFMKVVFKMQNRGQNWTVTACNLLQLMLLWLHVVHCCSCFPSL
jgi:hypothetical protein